DLALGAERRAEGAERDDGEVDRVEHQLDRHQHADRVAPGQEPERADGEEDPREDQVRVETVAHDGPPGSRLARKTPPMTAASSSTLTISKGNTNCSNSTRDMTVVPRRVRRAISFQSVALTPRAMTMATTTARIEAGPACVWKTSRLGASLV